MVSSYLTQKKLNPADKMAHSQPRSAQYHSRAIRAPLGQLSCALNAVSQITEALREAKGAAESTLKTLYTRALTLDTQDETIAALTETFSHGEENTLDWLAAYTALPHSDYKTMCTAPILSALDKAGFKPMDYIANPHDHYSRDVIPRILISNLAHALTRNDGLVTTIINDVGVYKAVPAQDTQTLTRPSV